MTWARAAVICAMMVCNTAILAGTAYVVFWLGHSGWWFALAVLVLDQIKTTENRRVTIARNGVVKLRGQPTRWRVKAVAKQFDSDLPYRLLSPEGVSRVVSSHRSALSYLESLTDEELMG